MRIIIVLSLFFVTSQQQTIEDWFSSTVPALPELSNDENREIYQFEQTLIVQDKSESGLQRCKVLEIYTEEQQKNIPPALAKLSGVEVQIVDMQKIFSLMNECDYMQSLDYKSQQNENARYLLWCDVQVGAPQYEDLGKNRIMDRCCRAYYFCPMRILPTDSRYNLTNSTPLKVSHCSCDANFRDCLARDNDLLPTFFKVKNYIVGQCMKPQEDSLDQRLKYVYVRDEFPFWGNWGK